MFLNLPGFDNDLLFIFCLSTIHNIIIALDELGLTLRVPVVLDNLVHLGVKGVEVALGGLGLVLWWLGLGLRLMLWWLGLGVSWLVVVAATVLLHVLLNKANAEFLLLHGVHLVILDLVLLLEVGLDALSLLV